MCAVIIYHCDLAAERFVSGKRFGESVPGIRAMTMVVVFEYRFPSIEIRDGNNAHYSNQFIWFCDHSTP